jgi:hypothetical protein
MSETQTQPISDKIEITIQEFREFVGDTIFTVEFIKRTDGTNRVMNARLGVKKGVTGAGLKFNPTKKNLLVCYDVQKLEAGATEKGAFRMINFDSIIRIKARGIDYTRANNRLRKLKILFGDNK